MRLSSTVARTPPASASAIGPSAWPRRRSRTRCRGGLSASAARAMATVTWSSTVTSATMYCTVAPTGATAEICSQARTSLSSVRPQIVTWAPSDANRVAVASPMPLPPPVTRVALPSIPFTSRLPR